MAGRFALDTSCIVAAVCGWHERHRVVAAAIERRLDAGERVTIAAPALTEAYSVLTRLPAPHRLAPADAWELLQANFVSGASIVVLSSEEHVALLRRLASAGIAGGRTYDAVIAECAVKAGVAVLLTLNPKDFDPAPRDITVLVPGA